MRLKSAKSLRTPRLRFRFRVLIRKNVPKYPSHSILTHETSIRLGTVGERRQSEVMETGRDGRFGSTPGRFEGIGFCTEEWRWMREGKWVRRGRRKKGRGGRRKGEDEERGEEEGRGGRNGEEDEEVSRKNGEEGTKRTKGREVRRGE